MRPFFEQVTRELRRSMSLDDLAAAHCLARELAGPTIDPDRVALLRGGLGLPDRVEVAQGPPAPIWDGHQASML